MDFDKVFTEKETLSLLTSCMLKYDPGHFSFKPRLFFTMFEKNLQLASISYGSEIELADIVFNVDDIDEYEEANFKGNLSKKPWFPHSTNGTHLGDALALTLRRCNNYYIDLGRFLGNINQTQSISTAISLKNSLIYKAIVSFMVACSHYDSLVPHLKWLCSSFVDKDYKEVIDLMPLQECIENKDFRDCNLILENDVTSCTIAPYDEAVCTPTISKTKYAMDWTGVDEENVIQIMHDSIVFTLEILNRIESIPDTALREILYSTFVVHNITENKIMSKLYTKTQFGIEITPEVRKVISVKDMEQRYYAIRDFVKSIMSDIVVAGREYFKFRKGINEMLCELIKYCEAESIMNIRIRQIYILYNYLKDHNLLKKINYGGINDDTDMPLPDGMLFSSDEDGVSEINTQNMLRNQFYDTNCDTSNNNNSDTVVENSSLFYEELDKLTSNFSSGGYTFKVETKNSEDLQAKQDYDTICANMGLLTTELIRSIKDIKVYNSGGKNPGKKTGKLDRKNLHRYKTSKDIFFDNTYKIRESDLAFGIILDASGSMSGEGIKYGRHTMVVLTEVLKALNINHCVISHNSNNYHTCNITRYQSFKEDKAYRCNKNYAITDIRAHSCNCDSGALFFMEQALLRTKNKDKICIIFSDGEPTECSDTELKEQIAHMERKGIKVIGVGIKFSKIKEYYRNNANGNNLKEMFEIVSDILKQYILEKVDKE